MTKKLDKLYKSSPIMDINDKSKIVIMSDCHRGAGDNFDNFTPNQNIYLSALRYYYNHGFTYIELGDGDEMWEVKNYHDIINTHKSTFKYLKRFHDHNRLIMIYGNHDLSKKSPRVLKKYFYSHYNPITKQTEPLLDNLSVLEALILNYNNHNIFLLHGHQVDFLNSNLWRLSRFLVRHLWRFLEEIGLKDPTSSAKNYQVTKTVEKKLQGWSRKNNKILIAGHTHRPIFPKSGESLYFNDGSCIHPNGITCLEIEDGHITLVKWDTTQTREQLDTKEPLLSYYK